MLKRIFSIFAIVLILTGLFFEGYSLECPVFADTTTDEWTQVTTNEQLVDAFKVYCKSRDLTIEGSATDVITSFTTQAFNGICNTLGIDVTALQAQIKYQTDENIGTRFLFSALGIDAYNRIFAQFLQDNDLEVGDVVNDEILYSGHYITDTQGYSCMTYEVNINNSSPTFVINASDITSNGTIYRYNASDIVSNISTHGANSPFLKHYFYTDSGLNNIGGNIPKSYYRLDSTGNAKYLGFYTAVNGNKSYAYYCSPNTSYTNLQPILISEVFVYHFTNDKYYLGMKVTKSYDDVPVVSSPNYFIFQQIYLGSNNTKPSNVYITTNNTTINNNNYDGDTIINNNGTSGNDDTPIIPPDPDEPTPDPPTLPDDGGWQDFQLPDMPNDWLIYGMEKKFPFDIPFNIMFGLSLLNHEPEIPKFEGDIDLKVCTWHYDIDLTPFDGIAQILRKFEVLAFIIGLAILTKELIMWG